MPHFNGALQGAVQSKPDRHLQKLRDAAAHRIDAFAAVYRHHFLVHLRFARIAHRVLLYLSWICLISGATRCIFNEVLYPVYFSGNNSMLMISVKTTMAQPQFGM